MNTALVIANLIAFFTFLVHTFGGDGAYRKIEPVSGSPKRQRIFWTMGRGAFHIVSIDFLFATIGLFLINFTDYFKDTKLLLNLLAIYFMGYAVAFFVTLMLSTKFENIYSKMWQWILMLLNATFIFLGTN